MNSAANGRTQPNLFSNCGKQKLATAKTIMAKPRNNILCCIDCRNTMSFWSMAEFVWAPAWSMEVKNLSGTRVMEKQTSAATRASDARTSLCPELSVKVLLVFFLFNVSYCAFRVAPHPPPAGGGCQQFMPRCLFWAVLCRLVCPCRGSVLSRNTSFRVSRLAARR